MAVRSVWWLHASRWGQINDTLFVARVTTKQRSVVGGRVGRNDEEPRPGRVVALGRADERFSVLEDHANLAADDGFPAGNSWAFFRSGLPAKSFTKKIALTSATCTSTGFASAAASAG